MAKIYFCGSIRGGRDLADNYAQIIKLLQVHGEVLTEHIADKDVIAGESSSLSDNEIYERDISWLEESDIVIAEVSAPSLGVGFEIAHAMHLKKAILCLYCSGAKHNLSAMVSGCPNVELIRYDKFSDLNIPIKRFIENVSHLDL